MKIKARKELEARMATVFAEKIKGCSMELQEILLDDMITAFEDRLSMFKRVGVN
ncbi:MAG: hypothetical protein ABSE15_03830 [Candidatus Bathyarchaeia archaeon]